MQATAWALLGYVAWIVVLLLCLLSIRSFLTLSGRRAANSYSTDGSDVSPACGRLARAHANCYEHFPIFGGLLLLALATDNTGVTDGLAYYWLAARIAQSLVHIASGSNLMAMVRFTFFVIQLALAIIWLYSFFTLY